MSERWIPSALAIAKVEFREILGYEMIALAVWGLLGVLTFGFLA